MIDGKPSYRVPTMTEIRALPWNGFKVASTFSGAGGSCLGYRMAGFKVVWANEFVPAAQASYKANAEPDCFLDCRDIHQVTPERILLQTGLKIGELDLFDGSPPCQAFSTAGKREKGWGQKKRYEHGASQCNETLFGEYIRLLRGLMPKVFVAENVSGLVKGVAKGYFLQILAALKASGYRVKCKVLDAQWLGVPQMRQRTIFIGVRNDLGVDPVFPKPLPYRYSVRDALPSFNGEMVTAGNERHTLAGRRPTRQADEPAPSIMATVSGFSLIEKQMPLPPSRLKAGGAFAAKDVAPDEPCPTITCASPGNDLAVRVYQDRRGAHGKEGYVTDQPSPTVLSGMAGNLWVEQPLSCVQAGAGASTSSGFSHGTCMVPGQRRKFTIAELKRICAFPDDFILTGTYAQAWSCLGNSVPPVMMKYIAESVRTVLDAVSCKQDNLT